MSNEHHALIDQRIAAALGSGWEVGGVVVLDDNSFAVPRHESHEMDYVTILWATVQDLEVANGGGNVVAEGKIKGARLSRIGTMDEVLAHIAREAPRLLASKRPRWSWALDR